MKCMLCGKEIETNDLCLECKEYIDYCYESDIERIQSINNK